MKKLLMPLLFVSLTAVASDPLWKKLYIRADGGVDAISATKASKFKYSPVYGVGVGFTFNEMFRADINFQHRKIDGDIKREKTNSLLRKADSNSIFLNGYFNLTDFTDMTPYLMAGVGYISNKTKDATKDQGNLRTFATGSKSSKMTWNVGVGITYNLHENIKADFGYKFLGLGDFKFTNTGQKLISTGTNIPVKFSADSKNVRSHEVTLGVVFKL